MRIILRNWHLKLSAVLLATVLYTGLVFSGSFTDSSVQVRVEQANVSRDVFVLGAEPGVVDVTFRVSNNDAGSVTADDFVVSVDISAYDLERAPEPQQLPLEWRSLKDGVEILSVVPDEVRVEVDRVEVRSVSVEVDRGTIPEGLEIDEPVVSAETVEVRGPASVVSQVDRAVAVRRDPRVRDQRERAGAADPGRHRRPAGRRRPARGRPGDRVRPDRGPCGRDRDDGRGASEHQTGTPAPGFALEEIGVDPAYVTIVGLPEVLAEITSVTTEPINIDGVSADETFEVELQLPEDVSLADGEPSSVIVTVTIGPSVSSRTFVVGVVCTGAGDNACLPRVEQIAITLSGAGEALSALTADDLTPTVDASGLDPGNHDVAPAVSGLPDGVELVEINPATVPVTIQAPQPPPTPTPTPAP